MSNTGIPFDGKPAPEPRRYHVVTYHRDENGEPIEGAPPVKIIAARSKPATEGNSTVKIIAARSKPETKDDDLVTVVARFLRQNKRSRYG